MAPNCGRSKSASQTDGELDESISETNLASIFRLIIQGMTPRKYHETEDKSLAALRTPQFEAFLKELAVLQLEQSGQMKWFYGYVRVKKICIEQKSQLRMSEHALTQAVQELGHARHMHEVYEDQMSVARIELHAANEANSLLQHQANQFRSQAAHSFEELEKHRAEAARGREDCDDMDISDTENDALQTKNSILHGDNLMAKSDGA